MFCNKFCATDVCGAAGTTTNQALPSRPARQDVGSPSEDEMSDKTSASRQRTLLRVQIEGSLEQERCRTASSAVSAEAEGASSKEWLDQRKAALKSDERIVQTSDVTKYEKGGSTRIRDAKHGGLFVKLAITELYL